MDCFCCAKKIKEKGNSTILLVLLIMVFLSMNRINASNDLAMVHGYSSAFALTAYENNVEGSLKNPATSIRDIHRRIIVNINESYGLDIYHGLVGTGLKYNQLYISVVAPFTTISGIAHTTVVNGSPLMLGRYNAFEISPQITLAKQMSKKFVLGASLQSLFEQTYGGSALGLSLDLGGLIRLNKINMGVSIQNIANTKHWNTGYNDTKPLKLNAGIMLKPLQNYEFLSDISIMKNNIESNSALHVRLSSYASIQMGIRDLGKTNQLRAGLSVFLQSMTIFYSFGMHSDLGDSHKLGLSIGI
jgi:hypothetical protein